MAKKPQQLLTYYSGHRAAEEDTQDLYLGTREMKPLLSLINRIQLKQEEQLKRKVAGDPSWTLIMLEVSELMREMEDMLLREVEANFEATKNKRG